MRRWWGEGKGGKRRKEWGGAMEGTRDEECDAERR